MNGQLRSMGPRAERALVGFARRNAGLLGVALAFAILAYGYDVVSQALSLDEEMAPTFATLGRINLWNVALYRWGLAAFNFAVIDGSNLPFLRPLLAICLLAVTATVYAGILPTSRAARSFFCLTFVTVPTFAFALTFSFMAVEFVLSCLLFVLGLKCLLDATGRRETSYGGVAAALLLWILAPSFYQDYGVVLTAYLVYVFFHLGSDEGQPDVRQALWFAGVLAASAVIYLGLSMLLVRLLSAPRVPYLVKYLAPLGLTALATFVQNVGSIYFSGDVYGTTSLAIAAISLPLLGASVPGSLGRRAGMAALGIAICFAPFAYGLGAIPPVRATSGLLFVAAGAFAFAVARSPDGIAFFVKCAVVYLALVNCIAVNNIFHYESLAWEADKALAIDLAQRIYDVAPDVHAGKVRVLFVGSNRRSLAWQLPGADFWVGMFDTWGRNITVRRQHAMNHAGFPAFELATEEDYDASLPTIERMPEWPDKGSVARFGDLVIVKLGPANGFALL